MPKENITTIGGPSTDAQVVRFDLTSLAVFLCGATSSVNLNLIGEVYVAELLLIPLGMILLIRYGDNGVFTSRSFAFFILFGLITLSGYMITDLVIGTRPSQYLRGWGRVCILLSNIVFLMIIVARGRQYLWWFIIGMGMGGVTYLWIKGVPFSVWKLGYGEQVSFIVLTLSCILPKKLSIPLLVGFAILNIGLDYRNLAAVYLLVAGILWVRRSDSNNPIKGLKSFLGLGLAVALVVTILAIGLSLTDKEYGDRRADSNAGRLAGIIVAIRAITDSPMIGYGSWSENEEYAKMIQDETRKREDPGRVRKARQYGVKTFRAHSQILQPWVEGGILGAAFFLFYAYRLALGARLFILIEPIHRFTAINLYFVILGAWNLIASPFGGGQRILIAITVAILASLELKKKRSLLAGSETSHLDVKVVAERNDRVLQRRREKF